MVDRSDLVVFYVEHEYGGAWQTMKYAVNQKKLSTLLRSKFDVLYLLIIEKTPRCRK